MILHGELVWKMESMFYYYGGKSKIIKYYPSPKFDTIIEPFAGAAWYSYTNHSNSIILNEKYDAIYDIWKWLINDATPEQILKFKDFNAGENIKDLQLEVGQKNLIGFCINQGSNAPKNIVQKWCCGVKSRPNWASNTSYRLTQIANNLHKIKNWKIKFGDYRDLPDIEATWFIDPPYQFGGEHYVENKIDYKELADWCLSRKGQIIVCENSKSNWLPFKVLTEIIGQKHKTTEVIYTV